MGKGKINDWFFQWEWIEKDVNVTLCFSNGQWERLLIFVSRVNYPGVSHWHYIHMCACLLRCFCVKFGIAIVAFSEIQEPKLHKFGVFLRTLLQKAPNLGKIGCFYLENGILKLGEIWYRESQIFKVWQVHPCMILTKVLLLSPPPPPPVKLSSYYRWRHWHINISYYESINHDLYIHHFLSNIPSDFCSLHYSHCNEHHSMYINPILDLVVWNK